MCGDPHHVKLLFRPDNKARDAFIFHLIYSVLLELRQHPVMLLYFDEHGLLMLHAQQVRDAILVGLNELDYIPPFLLQSLDDSGLDDPLTACVFARSSTLHLSEVEVGQSCHYLRP